MPRATRETPPGTILADAENYFGYPMIVVATGPHPYVADALVGMHFAHENNYNDWGLMARRFDVVEDSDAST